MRLDPFVVFVQDAVPGLRIARPGLLQRSVAAGPGVEHYGGSRSAERWLSERQTDSVYPLQEEEVAMRRYATDLLDLQATVA